MAFTCGFFNSQNGDRKYNAEQMASIFDGLIKDGVYDTVGDIFAVTPGTGMQVLVGSGRAWFDHTWNNNDAQYPLAITAADVSLPRYDAVVLETNHSDTVRTNRLRVLTGTPASNPVKPTMTSTANVKQHPLAYIKVTAGATAITQSMIQVVVGTSECPFVTGIIDTAQIDALFQQWNGEFNEWFENLKAQLSDNVVANLQGQIDQKVAKADVATTADIEAGTSTTKWVSPKGLKEAGVGINGTAYDVTTGKMVQIVTDPSILVLNKNFEWYTVMASGYSAPIGFLKDRFVMTGMKPVTVNSATKYHPMVNIYDNNCQLLKTVEEDSYDFESYDAGLIYYSDPGEYKTLFFAIHTSSSGVARYGGYYPHKNVVCFAPSNFAFTPIETSQYCLGVQASDSNLNVYYNNSPSDKSFVNDWSHFTLSFSNMSTQVIGAYGQYIYVGLYPKYVTSGSGKIARINISTKSTEVTYDIPTLSGFTIDPRNSSILDYPYAYMTVYKNQTCHSKLLRVDLRNGDTNFNDISSSSIVDGINSVRMIGYDANYYYTYPANSIGFTRISKSTCSIEIFPSIVSAFSNNVFRNIPNQTPTEPDYATVLTGLMMIDVRTLKWIPRTYLQDDTYGDTQWVTYHTSVASVNSLYLGCGGERATKRNLIYNPATSPYRYSDVVAIKE